MQCGGWTIDWQGKPGAVTPGGTTILAALRKTVKPGVEVTYAKDGGGGKGADVGLVVVGEGPYAEMQGDRADLALGKDDVAAVRAVKDAGLRVVVVILSGRPVILGEVAGLADAVVAAWLPGTEGEGVTDALFGTQPFTGRLSFTWPRSMEQVPVGTGAIKDPLYQLGFSAAR
jgi:beta-glucosidase